MPKYRIDPMPPAADPALIALLEQVEVATIGHVRHHGFLHRDIQAIDRHQRPRVGVAVTLALPAFCSTLMHHAVSLLQPGHMLVIDRLGDERHACIGGAVARAARLAGAAGVIVDGPATDIAEILAEGLPVWCRGTSAITTRQSDLGGLLNRPVSCGNVPVLPGDIVLGDASGVVVLSPDEAEDIARQAIARQERVELTMQRLSDGEKLGDITGANARILGQKAD